MSGNSPGRAAVQREDREDISGISSRRLFKGYKAKLVTALAVVMATYCLLFVAGFFGRFGYFIPRIAHNSISLAFIIALCFLLLPARKGDSSNKLPWYDVLIILVGIAGPVYNFFFWEANASRYAFMKYTTIEIIFAIATILVLLEAGRRALGLAIPLVQLLFLAHMIFGRHIPGPFHVHPIRISDVVNMAYQDVGIYGIVIEVAVTVVIMFLIFSQFMFSTGAGDFFMKFALSVCGHVRGGPAKVSVVASALMGMITGATMANVAGTGVFTIPLMKRIGYRPEFAGAVESVASNGGQIMPPVMGLVAFVMAEWLGMPYWYICVAAAVPALLYFFAVFVMVDAEAARHNLRGIPRSECPPVLKSIKEGWLFFIPVTMLILVLAILMYSPQTAILYALGVLVLLSLIKWAFGAYKKGGTTVGTAARSAWRVGIGGLGGGGLGMVVPGVACAGAGIIVGTLSITQIGIVLSDAVVEMAGGNQLLLLALAAFVCFILGMGMGSLPVYIMVVITVAPALLKFGVAPLVAHMFIFWFALTSFITPPVCGACFVAAAIAKCDPMKTGFVATRLGFCTFTLPFMFVYHPALLLQSSSAAGIVLAIIPALIGVLLLSWGLAGYALVKTNLPQRLLLLGGGLMFITLDWKLVAIGLAMGGVAIGWQVLMKFRQKVFAT